MTGRDRMPPEIVTAMVVEIDATHGAASIDRLLDVVRRAGAADIDVRPTDRGMRHVWAEFPRVGDSTQAAVELTRTLRAASGSSRLDAPAPGWRVALCTEEQTTAGGLRSSACPGVSATALLAFAGPGQVLATEATVIVTGGGLPPGADLVDRGRRSLGAERTPERVYELSIDGGDPGVAQGVRWARSNLHWARRAVSGVDGVDQELDRVLDVLVDAWRTAQGDGRRTVVLSGRGRGGTTRMAAELALRVHAEGALVLHGRWDPDVAAPYQGFREALGVYADGQGVDELLADLEGWGDEIGGLLPDVAARIGVRGAGAITPDTVPGDARERLLDAVEAWVRALARRRPTLLVLDDVHWAEPSSLLLVDHLHHAGAGVPLLVAVGVDEVDGDGTPRPTRPRAPEILTHADPAEVQRIDVDH